MAGKSVQASSIFSRPNANRMIHSATHQPLAILANDDRGRGVGVVTAEGMVQLPTGRTLIGFGPGGIVYVTMRDAGATRIEKRLFK